MCCFARVCVWVGGICCLRCVCVCEVRLGCCLVLWFSGNARGVGVTFSPSLSSICWFMGSALPGRLCWLLEQHCALSTPIWGQWGRWRPGQLSRCCYPTGSGSGLSEGRSFKIDSGGTEPFFIYLFFLIWKTTAHVHMLNLTLLHAHLKDTCTPSVGAEHPFNLVIV